MDVSFANSKLQKLCNSEKKLRGEYGPRMGALIQQRLADLAAAATLATMRQLPGRCHELKGDLKGHFAVDLVHPDRLVFRPFHHPLPMLADGGLDWSRITSIEIVGIGDYH
ncbi:MAG: killer suppression protein [Planctomycetia bacterium]|nr:killer suppression protein [Planctomycetia bacterium]